MSERVDAFGAAPLTSKAEPGDDVGAVHAGTLAGSQRSVPAADRRGAAAAGNQRTVTTWRVGSPGALGMIT